MMDEKIVDCMHDNLLESSSHFRFRTNCQDALDLLKSIEDKSLSELKRP